MGFKQGYVVLISKVIFFIHLGVISFIVWRLYKKF